MNGNPANRQKSVSKDATLSQLDDLSSSILVMMIRISLREEGGKLLSCVFKQYNDSSETRLGPIPWLYIFIRNKKMGLHTSRKKLPHNGHHAYH